MNSGATARRHKRDKRKRGTNKQTNARQAKHGEEARSDARESRRRCHRVEDAQPSPSLPELKVPSTHSIAKLLGGRAINAQTIESTADEP